MKLCKECSTEFEPVNQKGSEQIYCSRKCASKAAHKRRIEKLVNDATKKQEHEQPQPPRTENSQSGNFQREGVGGVAPEGRIHTTNDMALIEKLYEAKIELNLYKLKTENLENKVKELESEIFTLNSELEESENGEEDNNFIAGLTSQFKKDPVTTINMATAIFENMFKKPPVK